MQSHIRYSTEKSVSRYFMTTTANFGARPTAAIVDFCCDTLIKLTHLPRTELNKSLANMHKAMANLPIVAHCVRLNATKIILLHSIIIHFPDRVKCNSILSMPGIPTLVNGDIQELCEHYNKSQQPTTADRLSSIAVPKLKSTT